MITEETDVRKPTTEPPCSLCGGFLVIPDEEWVEAHGAIIRIPAEIACPVCVVDVEEVELGPQDGLPV